jgi:hypothetical protein
MAKSKIYVSARLTDERALISGFILHIIVSRQYKNIAPQYTRRACCCSTRGTEFYIETSCEILPAKDFIFTKSLHSSEQKTNPPATFRIFSKAAVLATLSGVPISRSSAIKPFISTTESPRQLLQHSIFIWHSMFAQFVYFSVVFWQMSHLPTTGLSMPLSVEKSVVSLLSNTYNEPRKPSPGNCSMNLCMRPCTR